MDDDFDLKNFDNVCRLFPLPGVVLFPHAVLPLHIFEPRYRQMTEDALATDRLIAIVQVKTPAEWTPGDEPALEPIGCLGRIFKHERLPDGRFNFLLLGRKRIRLDREVANGKLYRSSEITIIEDEPVDTRTEARRRELVNLFRAAHEGEVDPDLDAIFEGDLPLGVLADIITQALGLPAATKQWFLAEPSVASRVAALLDRLRGGPAPSDGLGAGRSTFPPPFSRN